VPKIGLAVTTVAVLSWMCRLKKLFLITAYNICKILYFW